MPVPFNRTESPRSRSLAAIMARLGVHAQEIGATVIEELRDLMSDMFTQEDRRHHRFSSYFLQLWEQQEKIISDAMTYFFTMASSMERNLIDKALGDSDDKQAKVQAYLIGLSMVALLNNHKVVDNSFVDHSNEFSYLVERLVELRLGESSKGKFKEFAEHCQGVYNAQRAAAKAETNVTASASSGYAPIMR